MGSEAYSSFVRRLLSEREQFFDDVVEGRGLRAALRRALWTVVGCGALYGMVAGAYSGWAQALATAVKLPVLLLGTLIVCFPVFFVVQVLMGSRLRLLQVLVLVLSCVALMTVLLAAFVPITLFFLLTGADYYFQHLLHIAIGLVAGVFGMYALHEGLSVICERRGVYPRKALTMMRIWALVFAFVGIQMAWKLRPFLGDRSATFAVFGNYEGNFYTAVAYAVNKLVSGAAGPPEAPPQKPLWEILPPVRDTVADSGAGVRR